MNCCDAHVHIGYYSRKSWREPFYYSPRRVLGVLDRCEVKDFIVSSTCAQMECLGIEAMVREAREMKRLAGRRAHVFFWLSGHLYDEDPQMGWMKLGMFEGIKLHEGETPWMQKRRKDVEKILSAAEMHDLPVMFHAGLSDWCCPLWLAKIALRYPTIRFNFAHCRPMDEMAKVIADCPNVWTDTAYMALDEFPKLPDYNWHGRLMLGTDLPVWQAYNPKGLTKQYRAYVQAFNASGLLQLSCKAFREYLGGYEDMVNKPKLLR